MISDLEPIWRQREQIEIRDDLGREELNERLDTSQTHAETVFESITAEALHSKCAEGWWSYNDATPTPGPLDSMWFAVHMVRHSGYHWGQINVYLFLLGTCRQ